MALLEVSTTPNVSVTPLRALEARRGDYVVSIKEAAAILTVCTKTVRNLIGAGKIQSIAVSERRRGILASELARYMTGPAAAL